MIKEYKESDLKEVYDFIMESIHKINFETKGRQDILILLPPHYKMLMERYFCTSFSFNFNSNRSSIPINNISFQGIECQFISPENKCYVYLKDYTLYSGNTENINFKMILK